MSTKVKNSTKNFFCKFSKVCERDNEECQGYYRFNDTDKFCIRKQAFIQKVIK